MSTFSKKLLQWYNPNERNLPWKQTNDAFKIWLSEIILQQTRVAQGTPYYLAFIKKYPTISKLAKAPLDEILKLWEGLGYYSRARNLHQASIQIMEKHNGHFPNTYPEILQLKGVGKYTAAAIASFAYGLPYAVVDGNVYRVLARVFGIEIPIDSTLGKKHFEEIAQQLLDKDNAALYNQAIMDFGALVCKPSNPLCNQCPSSSSCIALTQDKIQHLPVKTKKITKTTRHFHYFVIHNTAHILIQQRMQNDIWHGLFEFPMIETKDHTLPNDTKSIFGSNKKLSTTSSFSFKQELTHQTIRAHFHEIKLSSLPRQNTDLIHAVKRDLTKYVFPKIIHSYLQVRLIYLT